MKIIALEGLDKAGKHTQADLLEKDLEKTGARVKRAEFINYKSETGKMLMKFLRSNEKVDNFTIQLLQMINKQEEYSLFRKFARQKIDYLILDRFTLSEFIYGYYFIMQDVNNGNINHDEFQHQIKMLDEFTSYLSPKVDLNIYVDIDVKTSIGRKGEYGDNDRYERNKALHSFVRDTYTKFANSRNDMFKVNGMQSPELVHKELMKKLDKFDWKKEQKSYFNSMQ